MRVKLLREVEVVVEEIIVIELDEIAELPLDDPAADVTGIEAAVDTDTIIAEVIEYQCDSALEQCDYEEIPDEDTAIEFAIDTSTTASSTVTPSILPQTTITTSITQVVPVPEVKPPPTEAEVTA